MDDTLRDLKERITQMSDGELLRIVGPDRDDYRHEAIAFAQDELRLRHIPFDEYDAGDEAESVDGADDRADVASPARVMPPCAACGRPTRQGLLLSDKELTVYFQDTEEERFVEAFVCGACGEVRLIADLHTDVER